MNRFEKELPAGYREVYRIDARNKKTGLLLNGAALVVFVAVMGVVLPTADLSSLFVNATEKGLGSYMLSLGGYMLVSILSLVAYVVLHELTHGIFYKAMTKQKLKYGFGWSCAFCGVPDVYVSRKTAIFALAAPLVVFTVILLPLTVLFAFFDTAAYLLFGVLLGLHLGGCSGDAYMLLLLFFKYKDPALLLRDSGPEQWIYLPESSKRA